MREALDRGVRVGLGTDVAGGYNVDIMGAMRWAVGVARLSDGAMLERSEWQASGSEAEDRVPNPMIATRGISVDWKEALYLGTRGGALALGLGGGVFKNGLPFDAQQSTYSPSCMLGGSYADFPLLLVCLFNPSAKPRGTGSLDFLNLGHGSFDLSPEVIEKWWCLGDTRNRTGMWIQGKRIIVG